MFSFFLSKWNRFVPISMFFFFFHSFRKSFSLSLSSSLSLFIYSDRSIWSSMVTEMKCIIVAILECVSKKKIDFWMQRNRDCVSVSVAIFKKRSASEMVIVKHFSFSCFHELSLSVTYNLWITLKGCNFVYTIDCSTCTDRLSKVWVQCAQMQYGNHYQ